MINKIGIFDSGVGGLTVWAEIRQQLPTAATFYIADNLHCPYGPRPPAEIITLSITITDFLVAQGCELIVVACNTASAAALPALRARFNVPIVGMEPAVKPAALRTKTGHIGILATQGTFKGDLLKKTTQMYAQHLTVHQQIAHGLVPLVERGELSSPYAKQLLTQYLSPFLAANVDQLVLGCTHYPFLIPLMKEIGGEQMTILDPAAAVARQVARRLGENKRPAPIGPEPQHQFFATGQAQTLTQLLTHLGYPAASVASLVWQGEQKLQVAGVGLTSMLA